MRVRRLSLGLLLIVLTGPLALAHDAAGRGHAWRFPLATAGAGMAWRIEPGPAVYAASERPGDLADLVVIDAEGRVMPMQPWPAEASRLASAASAPMAAGSEPAGGPAASVAAPASAQSAPDRSGAFAVVAAGQHWLPLRVVRAGAEPQGGYDYDYSLPAPLPVDLARIRRADHDQMVSFTLENASAGDAPLATIVTVPVAEANGKPQFSSFGAVSTRRLRLHVAQALSAPPLLEVGWRPATLVFLADGHAPYSLLTGSRSPRRADPALATTLARLRPAAAGVDWRPPLATLGAGIRLAAFAGVADQRQASPARWRRLLPWGLLLIAALAVAWLLLRKRAWQ